MLCIHQIENEPTPSNCFVVHDKAVGEGCLIVDAGSEKCDSLFQYLECEGLRPEYIILTHEHFDHCWGVNVCRQRFPDVKLVCSALCSDAIQDRKRNYSVFFQQPGFEVAAADVLVENVGWRLEWNGYEIRFVPAQGHSAAGVVFFVDRYVFTGDSLIKNLKTVTKLKTASKERLLDTIALLEGEKGRGLTVCPGHGEMFGLDTYNLDYMINGKGV